MVDKINIKNIVTLELEKDNSDKSSFFLTHKEFYPDEVIIEGTSISGILDNLVLKSVFSDKFYHLSLEDYNKTWFLQLF